MTADVLVSTKVSRAEHRHLYAPDPILELKKQIYEGCLVDLASSHLPFEEAITECGNLIKNHLADAHESPGNIALSQYFRSEIDSRANSRLQSWIKTPNVSIHSEEFLQIQQDLSGGPNQEIDATWTFADSSIPGACSSDEKEIILQGLGTLAILQLTRFGRPEAAIAYLRNCRSLSEETNSELFVDFDEFKKELIALTTAARHTNRNLPNFERDEFLQKLVKATDIGPEFDAAYDQLEPPAAILSHSYFRPPGTRSQTA